MMSSSTSSSADHSVSSGGDPVTTLGQSLTQVLSLEPNNFDFDFSGCSFGSFSTRPFSHHCVVTKGKAKYFIKCFRRGSHARFIREQEILKNPQGLDFIPRLFGCGILPLDADLKNNLVNSIGEYYRLHLPNEDPKEGVREIQDGGTISYTIMEFVEGATLQDFVNDGNDLEFEKILVLFGNLISTLESFHRYGFLHRDLSPENIMVLSNGHLMLIDFGVSFLPTVTDAFLTKQNTFFNKFLSLPEYETHTECRSKGSDWTYAAGILYFMLFREHPKTIEAFRKEDAIIPKLKLRFPEQMTTLRSQVVFSFFASFKKDITDRQVLDAKWMREKAAQMSPSEKISPSPAKQKKGISEARIGALKSFYGSLQILLKGQGFRCSQTTRHAQSAEEATVFQIEKHNSTHSVILKVDPSNFFLDILPLSLTSADAKVLLDAVKEWASSQ